MRAQAGDRGGDIGVRSRPLEIAEEHVVAEAYATRPRLDPGQVDRARGELGEAVDEAAVPGGGGAAVAGGDEAAVAGGDEAAVPGGDEAAVPGGGGAAVSRGGG